MTLSPTYSATDLAGLTPDERAALEAADGTDKDVLEELAQETPQADQAVQAAAPDAAAPSPDAAAPSDAPANVAEPAANTLIYNAANVGDVAKETAAQRDAIKSARAEKREALMKLNDGEIDADAYAAIEDAADAKIDAANDAILALNRSQVRGEVAAEFTQQQQERAWNGMLRDYAATAKAEDGLDYAANEALRNEFNSLVRVFAAEAAGARGMVDGADMAASAWALKEAAQVMRIRHPKTAPSTQQAQGQPPAAPQGSNAPAIAAMNGLQTLSRMPAAAAAPVADDVMAKIGALEGEELELYMANLPRDVFARVTAGAQ